jgi:hypothetical protein
MNLTVAAENRVTVDWRKVPAEKVHAVAEG